MLRILLLALPLSLPPSEWDPEKAGQKLDERAAIWKSHPRTQRSHETSCISCHTGTPYLLARPTLRRTLGERDLAPPERALLEGVATRVTKWSEAEPWYSHTEAKIRESRGTEAILNALVLSYRERAEPSALRGKTGSLLRTALANLWGEQRADGGFDWLHFDLAPWETDESDFFGSCLAAVAASRADTAEPFARLAEYLRSPRPSLNLHSRLGLLWAEASRPGLVDPEVRDSLLKGVLEAQREDGGFALSDLGPWKRKMGLADAYATGLAVHVLRELGDPAARSAVEHGLFWLVSHQDQSGGWTAESVNRDRSSDEPFTAGFMSDAATAFAVLALSPR